MQTIGDMLDKLASIDGEGFASFENIKLRVTEFDGMAGQLLIWLLKNMPDNSTNGDVLQVLDDARFWLKFIGASAEKIDKETK